MIRGGWEIIRRFLHLTGAGILVTIAIPIMILGLTYEKAHRVVYLYNRQKK